MSKNEKKNRKECIITAIDPSSLKREKMTLDEFVENVKKSLSESKGVGTLSTKYQWFTNHLIFPYMGEAFNVSHGYEIAGIEDTAESDKAVAVVDALTNAGIKISASEPWFYLEG